MILFIFFLSFWLRIEDQEVKVTYYNKIGKTATGELTSEIQEPFVAVSRDLIEKFPMGSKILIYHCDWEGVYSVRDKMGKNHTNSIDVFSPVFHAATQKCKCKLLDSQ